ncbi:hypothetical protein [Clostridium grantii]|uniref:Helix-turn-helix domain-containing protein n=1 Tax=Clostridium grantii DSM 8605 TaxID=1121316 RepID=A0A1M5RAW4_9CLOT|nr:hypothetical protein [Clostridium grantii]SHH23482.1 hypothetical protein SAMN02745207_00429 [Clostridium grantii DSM 8605]
MLEERYEDIKKDNDILGKCTTELKNKVSKIINKENLKKHNDRGAGRKSILPKEQLMQVETLHKQGLSYSKTEKEVGLASPMFTN